MAAVEELRSEGKEIDIRIVEGVTNAQVRELISEADVVVDQLVLGWYAMFALEGMAMAKPVVCHIRPDLLELYLDVGLLAPGELPLVDASVRTIKETLGRLAELPRSELEAMGRRSRDFAVRHHSVQSVGRVFDRINRGLGLEPR